MLVLKLDLCASLLINTDSVGAVPVPEAVLGRFGPTTIVLGPIITFVADGARLITVPLIVIGLPPGTSVWLCMTNTEEAPAVTTEPPIVMAGATVVGVTSGCAGTTLLPMTTVDAPGARESAVPDRVMTEPPGTSV